MYMHVGRVLSSRMSFLGCLFLFVYAVDESKLSPTCDFQDFQFHFVALWLHCIKRCKIVETDCAKIHFYLAK